MTFLLNYIKSARPLRNYTFLWSLIPIIIYRGGLPVLSDWIFVLKALVIFGILYCGLYALNDYSDRFEDIKTGLKNNIVGTKIATYVVLGISFALIIASLILCILFFNSFLNFWSYFLISNIAYSFVLKRQARLLGNILMAFSIPVKMLLGLAYIQANLYEVLVLFSLMYLLNLCVSYVIKDFYRGVFSKDFTLRLLLMCLVISSLVYLYALSIRSYFMSSVIFAYLLGAVLLFLVNKSVAKRIFKMLWLVK